MLSPLLRQVQTLLQTPSDLVILLVLAISFFIGAKRGLLSAVLGFFTRLIALACASLVAKIVAPLFAKYVVTPIVGEIFLEKANETLATVSPAADALTGVFEGLEKIGQTVTDVIHSAAMQAAQAMAESLSYVLVFIFLFFAFHALLRVMTGTANSLTNALAPVGLLNHIAGGVLGLVGGWVLLCMALWVIYHFAPTTFSAIGILSPTVVEKSVLTKALLTIVLPSVVV